MSHICVYIYVHVYIYVYNILLIFSKIDFMLLYIIDLIYIIKIIIDSQEVVKEMYRKVPCIIYPTSYNVNILYHYKT